MLLTREMKSPKQRQNNVLTAKHNFKNLIKSQGTKGKKLHYKKHGKFQYFEVFQVTLRSFCVLGDAEEAYSDAAQPTRPIPIACTIENYKSCNILLTIGASFVEC